MKIALLFALSALCLASCDVATTTSEAGAEDKIERREVALVAVAPDGTKLWGVRPSTGARVVYFSSGSTQTAHRQHCGKNCIRTVDDIVPMADGGPSREEGE